VKLDVQDDWRSLDQAKRNYEISEVGVDLSQRRVAEQELLMELGRGTARDLVDARTDLINARNQRTSALVQHTLARLKFWRDLGVLYIKENGQWREMDRFEKMASIMPKLLSQNDPRKRR
jgi:outer membrane protein TolC